VKAGRATSGRVLIVISMLVVASSAFAPAHASAATRDEAGVPDDHAATTTTVLPGFASIELSAEHQQRLAVPVASPRRAVEDTQRWWARWSLVVPMLAMAVGGLGPIGWWLDRRRRVGPAQE
jgi:hypothetical protein